MLAALLQRWVPIQLGSEAEKPVKRSYVTAPHAPASNAAEQVEAKSAGCVSCHTESDTKTMHRNPAVKLGCTDCHGGNASAFNPDRATRGDERPTTHGAESAHVLPQYPGAWQYPQSANPKRTYTLLNKEAPEFVRFVNPSDYRLRTRPAAPATSRVIEASKRSMHSTGAMLWGGASYNNGISAVQELHPGLSPTLATATAVRSRPGSEA